MKDTLTVRIFSSDWQFLLVFSPIAIGRKNLVDKNVKKNEVQNLAAKLLAARLKGI